MSEHSSAVPRGGTYCFLHLQDQQCSPSSRWKLGPDVEAETVKKRMSTHGLDPEGGSEEVWERTPRVPTFFPLSMEKDGAVSEHRRLRLSALAPPSGTYPIQKQALSVEYLRDHAHLRPRTDASASMLCLQTLSLDRSMTFSRYVPTLSNTCIPSYHQSPAGSPPHSEFFSHPAYLTVSSQLHLEALAASLARVYTLSPCFRAEPSQTNRHLAEFWMLEAEWAWTRGVDDVCGLVDACAKHALGAGGDERALLTKGIAGHEERLRSLEAAASSEPWARMIYTEAIAELEKYHASSDAKARPFVFEPKWGQGLQSEHEKWLNEVLVKGPVFVTDYPSSVKPFYMRMNDDERSVACFDLWCLMLGN
ncbi:hypothetical protein PAXINDRAFT_101319 [Paxillus involutus ATCC 200175]|uniref:Aminoacyl-tRNA synthetase class II (D/K/N) domain-containing protein n=1 Tax=Paxillus involutus ATCC 200175 TaxID=664439 RepID=A0A0C9TY69_PAXIN|nr:hypothetical protein PAXINDRAFT_101319 [Paxillus involutus ATCC 200175]